MRFSLAALFRRLKKPRRTTITLRKIAAPATYATNLYHAAYRQVIATWGAALPDILATYERSLSQLQTDAPADLAAVIGKVESEILGILINVRARLERWAALIEAWQRGKWRGAVLTATGVDLQTMIGPTDARETLQAVIERNVSLVRSVSDQARSRIEDAVYRGLKERRPAADVAKDIRGAVDMSRRRALNIAADQTVKVTAALNEERRRQAGIDTFEWIHSAKLHPRQWHLARNGKLFSENPDKVGTDYEGKRINAAPDAGDMPGQPPFCGCTARAVLIL